jgi:hypothetical protein
LESSCPKISIIDEELVVIWNLTNYQHLIIKQEVKQKNSTFKKLFSKPTVNQETEELKNSFPSCLKSEINKTFGQSPCELGNLEPN